MGVMIDGIYSADDGVIQTDKDGNWHRARSSVRNWVTADGSAGPTGTDGFAAEPGRYHLYAAWNCPWAHRALLTRVLLGLEDQIDVSYALPRRTPEGWVFDPDGSFKDKLFNSQALHEIYSRGVDAYTGRITVPVLWDNERQCMVTNESADIVRMLNAAFEKPNGEVDLYPDNLRQDIDDWNAVIYDTVNNGVYRAGFATTQDAYEVAARQVFVTLDRIEAQLANNRYLTGDRFTEADVRLFPTLARFDVAYHTAFRCNLRRIIDYPNLWAYAREIFQMPGIAATVDFDIYKRGYFSPSENRNPLGIVPIGPDIDWSPPHGR